MSSENDLGTRNERRKERTIIITQTSKETKKQKKKKKDKEAKESNIRFPTQCSRKANLSQGILLAFHFICVGLIMRDYGNNLTDFIVPAAVLF